MTAKIVVYDGDKEILNMESKVVEVLRADKGCFFKDCFIKARFSIAETEKENVYDMICKGGSYLKLPDSLLAEGGSDDIQ